MKHKKIFVFSIVILVGVLVAAGYFATHLNNADQKYFCLPSSGECANPTLKHTDKSEFIELSRYYIPGTGGYECSRPIKLVSNTVNKKGEHVEFNPVDASEADLFCHMTSAEEYKGKIKVLQKSEVLSLISKYAYKDVFIKALEFKYITDKEFVQRLLPAYRDRVIGCIIVLNTPGEDKVYLEDEKLDTFEELDYKTFARFLETVGPADRQLFYDNLK